MASGLWLVFVHNNDDSLSQFNLEGFILSHYWVSKDNINLKKKKKITKLLNFTCLSKSVSIFFIEQTSLY